MAATVTTLPAPVTTVPETPENLPAALHNGRPQRQPTSYVTRRWKPHTPAAVVSRDTVRVWLSDRLLRWNTRRYTKVDAGRPSSADDASWIDIAEMFVIIIKLYYFFD